ncbi:MAG: bifunctional DNA primase/polymerase [Pyrinomonadaceae bacterium]|nr:bifunctional DNA primase/polymerase [Pyrinomonadaceae bacterium]MBP6211522.1 bifunctional DNA primase/polymerase [Pyrinomonadaceae bacterium]
MTRKQPKTTTGSTSTRQAASEYRARGWAIVPIPLKKKAPNLKGWQDLEIVAENVDQYFKNELQNIGVLLGERSGGLVDVDLDSPEAVRLADHFLPATSCIFGRKGKESSHRLYLCEEAKYLKFYDPSVAAPTKPGERHSPCIVEIRTGKNSKGMQTVFPPSVHPSGEQINWVKNGEPATVTADQLEVAVMRLAAASVLAKIWGSTARHDLSLALSSALLRHGWNESDGRYFIEGICHAANDEETEDRLLAFDDTAANIAAGRKTTGIPKLTELIGKTVVDNICKWLEINPKTEHSERQLQGKAGDADGPDDQGRSMRENQSQKIMHLVDAAGVGFFHTADGETFASIPVNSHRENHDIGSKFVKNWIGQQYWESEEKVPNSQALSDALNALKGKAIFDSPQHEIYVRLAEFDKKIYLDMGNEGWQVVEITTHGWKIIEANDCPIKFRRPKGQLPLPTPITGGDLRELGSYVNVVPEHVPLVCIYLVACLRPDKPFPILLLNGEQGSGKSTTSRVLKRLVDPNKAELRPPPRDERDLMIAATNGWFLVFDNLAKIPDWLSDALCRLSTGGGFGTRALYANNEETLFSAMRPVMLNGITELASRPDALDRALLINCPNISKTRRRDEATHWMEFDTAHARLLGALLTALSTTLGELPNVHLAELERMADFQLFGVAAEKVLGFDAGTFQKAYSTNRREASDVAIDSSPTAIIVIAFILQNGDWTGTATKLLADLKKFAEDEKSLGIRLEDLPKKANLLSGELKRTAPNLRANGVEFSKSKSGSRTISLLMTVNESSESSESPSPNSDAGFEESVSDDPDYEEDDTTFQTDNTNPWQTSDLGGLDDVDDSLQNLSSPKVNINKNASNRDSSKPSCSTGLPMESEIRVDDRHDRGLTNLANERKIVGKAGGRDYVVCVCGRDAFAGKNCEYCGIPVVGV